jgi:D-alanyl-D-alanine carboxypeptidase (penicillin-binding protein 5/6)
VKGPSWLPSARLSPAGSPAPSAPARPALLGGRARARPRPRFGGMRGFLRLALMLLLALLLLRLVTVAPPDARVSAAIAGEVRIPGTPPRPAWPAAGEAALTVPGIASLGASREDPPRPIASVAKVMTAYLTLERFPLAPGHNGFSLRITRAEARAEAADLRQDQSVLPVAAGERLNERQLLEGLLIPSGNNIARILAVYETGSVGRFLAEMNATARSLGMDHTRYTDPSGFATSTVSTAADQLRVFLAALRFPAFRAIISTAAVTLPVAGTVTNYDPLIGQGYDGKTGSDGAAEGCLAFVKHLRVGGRRIPVVGVVLGQGVGENTTTILDAAGAAAEALVHSVAVRLGVERVLPARHRVLLATTAAGARVRGVTVRALSVIGWPGLTERLRMSARHLGEGVHPGETIGRVALAGPLPLPLGEDPRTPVRATANANAPGFGWRVGHLL